MKTFQKIASTMALFAMVLGLGVADVNAANINGTFSASVAAADDQSVTLNFTTTGALASGDFLYINVPGGIDSSATVPTHAIANLGAFTQVGPGTLADGYTFRAEATGAVGGGALAVDFTDLDLAGATNGQYTFSIYTEDSTGALIDSGSALLSVANTVTVTAVVQEAVVMTIANPNVTFNADPSVNGGQDTSQTTTLTVSSNAWDGFNIEASLDSASFGGAGAPNLLVGATHNATIGTSGADNYFRWNSEANGTLSTVDGTNDSSSTYREFGQDITGAAGSEIYISGTGGTDLSNAQTITVGYDFNVDFSTPADTYQGIITYTMVPTF